MRYMENVVELEGSQLTIWRMRVACWITKTTDTLRICTTCCFSSATMVSLTRLHVALYVSCLSCFYISVSYQELIFSATVRNNDL